MTALKIKNDPIERPLTYLLSASAPTGAPAFGAGAGSERPIALLVNGLAQRAILAGNPEPTEATEPKL